MTSKASRCEPDDYFHKRLDAAVDADVENRENQIYREAVNKSAVIQ